MTTIISRLYADQKTAQQAVTALKLQNHPDDLISVIPAGSGAEQAMIDAHVPENSSKLYADKMSGKNTLVVYRAPITPFGAARNAIMTLDEFDSIDAGVENQNFYQSTAPQVDQMLIDLKVDRTHSHWATWGRERPRGTVSGAFGLPLLTGYKNSLSVYRGKKFFGNFIMGHLSGRRPGTENTIRRNAHYANFIVPLISRSGPYSNVIRSGGYANVS
jgi:hypothetical protein